MRIMVIGHTAGRAGASSPGEPNPTLDLWMSYASSGTQIDLANPEPYETPGANGSDATDQHLQWHMSVPALVQKTIWAEQNGYDAVIQSNNFEHGVEASRLAVRIPVLGLCRTTVLHAANLADRVGITVPLDGYFVVTRRLLDMYRLNGFVSGLQSFGFDAVPRPEQIPALKPRMFERAVEVMRGLIKNTGAECIVPLGGAVIPSILDPKDLEREVGAPVLNPRAIGIRTAETYVTLGLAQSPLTYSQAKLAIAR
jgi:allantoin racemase